MSWTEIVLEVPRQQAELVSDALIEAGALSVSVEDANEGTDAEQPLFGEPGMERIGALAQRHAVGPSLLNLGQPLVCAGAGRVLAPCTWPLAAAKLVSKLHPGRAAGRRGGGRHARWQQRT